MNRKPSTDFIWTLVVPHLKIQIEVDVRISHIKHSNIIKLPAKLIDTCFFLSMAVFGICIRVPDP